MRKRGSEKAQPSSDDQTNGTPALTIFGDTARIEGKFEIPQSLHVECEIEGELVIGGKLIVGENGAVNANVQTVDAIIEGQFEGELSATGDVHIASSGRVVGHIKTNSLVIAHGAFFNGNVTQLSAQDGQQTPLQLVEERRRNPGRGA